MKRKVILTALFILFIAGAAFSGFKVFTTLKDYREGEKTYGELQQHVHIPAAEKQETSPKKDESPNVDESAPPRDEKEAEEKKEPPIDIAFPEVDFDGLKAVSEDVVAWIYVEGTNINYPVAVGEDNQYYVSAMIDGKYNPAGSIFMDYRNARDFSDANTIFYGHNMNNGTMFHDICLYKNQKYYDAHPIGLVMTPEKNYWFEIVAGYTAELSEGAWQREFVSYEGARSWLEDAQSRSGFVSEAEYGEGDRFITLSTCSHDVIDARFILLGILREA